MLPSNLAFVDIETTGTSSSSDRIIEIGILRVENNTLVKSFQSLINPQSYLPREITMLTGITQQDIENAPTFRSIKDEILDTLKDCTFVAHNVRFDYAFLKHEFLRENISYSTKHFCTVRLSRILFPQWQRHNLDTVINECNIVCQNRHRAYDDAQVLYAFYQKILKTFPEKKLKEALAKTMKTPSLPLHLPLETLDTLPEKPGVYIFFGNESDIPLYIGKSVNIRNRVLSHFSSDISSPTDMHIAQQIKRIETMPTAGELGALLLESQLIKDMLPIYNKKSRVKHELIAVKKRTNKQGYEECYLEPITQIDANTLQDFLGFYRSRKQARATLSDIAKTYLLCGKLLGLEKTKGACFAYRLNRCRGACIGKEKTILHNLKLHTAFTENKILPWPFDGAILIQENDGINNQFGFLGKREYFLIDNWCYMGTVTVDTEENINNKELSDISFDLDIYKILRQFLRNPANQKKITIIGKERKTQLTSVLPTHLRQ
jgi:DNA polymerase-3 subunit epsilon